MEKGDSTKVLIVDDSSFMRNILKDILVSNGFSRIYEAGDGPQAIESFKKHKPDLITMDLIMPGP
ncbi:MAG: response regulator, partial [Nitrososphaerota archaeon]